MLVPLLTNLFYWWMISKYNKILIVGNLNLDQMLPKNVANIAPLIQSFDLSQRSQYYRIYYGIYNILWNTWGSIGSSNYNIASILPSPYSDHFVIFFFNLRARYDLNFCCQQYPLNSAHYYNYHHFKCLVGIELVKNSENCNYFFFFFWYMHVEEHFINS